MYYFASDVHLGMEGATSSAEREKLFTGWLEEVSEDARAIFLVGDIFDFWFEFARVVPKGFTRLLGKLSELTDRGIEVHYFLGNHDMWSYGYLETECGIILHKKAEVFELHGKRFFIAHGDNLYAGKRPWLEGFMQSCFRSRFMRWVFGHLLHPDWVVGFGMWWSAQSRKSHAKVHVFCGEKEYLVRYARAYQDCLKNVSVDYFIFGHIHCANVYDMGDGHTAVFLGEWLYEPVYAVVDHAGKLELKKYEK